MPHFPAPSSLSTAELVRYAELALGGSTALPLNWQEELVKRLDEATKQRFSPNRTTFAVTDR